MERERHICVGFTRVLHRRVVEADLYVNDAEKNLCHFVLCRYSYCKNVVDYLNFNLTRVDISLTTIYKHAKHKLKTTTLSLSLFFIFYISI